ncbi:hypothetical protein [Catellatospora bangladeshensis]|uniref:Uncharacterized protein n=1 Tax=Catellatospora bangladeshensis TaxID=310355 RepID=A0A8J3JIC0_9ACTN|nr:hypothetical protein [Catellatospora bangladeshensis]GIF81173.1 hypothetical protein Cba03nite_25220 [Catellatospora bangladeshensis]
MRKLLKSRLARLVAVSLAIVAPAVPAAAESIPVTRLTFSGDDSISMNQSYAYTSTTPGLTVSLQWYTSGLKVDLRGVSDVPHLPIGATWGQDWWTLELSAAGGQELAVGTVTGAKRIPYQDGAAGMDLSGSGRGCNTLTGSFTIHELAVTDGTLERLNLTFEQQCGGDTGSTRGRLLYGIPDMPPLPGPGDTGVTVKPDAVLVQWMNMRPSPLRQRTSRKSIVVKGTAKCARGRFEVKGKLEQYNERGLADGTFSTSGECTGAWQQWSATVVSMRNRDDFMTGGGTTVMGEGWTFGSEYYQLDRVLTSLSQPVTVAASGQRPGVAVAVAGSPVTTPGPRWSSTVTWKGILLRKPRR